MKNKTKHPQSPSGRSLSAADRKTTLVAQARHLVDLLLDHLAIPTPAAFLAAHAKALDTVPMPVPGTKVSCVPLFGPTSHGDRQIETSAVFSAQQRQRLEDVLNDVLQNHQLTEENFVPRAAAALDRVPLGEVSITADAAASPIPPQMLYVALHAHRRCREDQPVSGATQSIPSWIETFHSEPDGAWPEFVIVTEPDGTATLIALLSEAPGLRANQSRN